MKQQYYGSMPDINKIGHDRMVEKVLEKAKNEEFRILETDFIELYGDEEVHRNLEAVIGLKKEFDSISTSEDIEAKKLADVLEFIMNKQIELSDWLGEGVCTYKTAYYDDWVNGVDTLLEFNREDDMSAYMGIAFDITYSEHLHKKLNRIKEEIKNGRMATVKYFKSESGDFMGRLSNIPRLVIGVDRKTIDELMDLEMEKQNKKLSEYFLQYQIIDEMIIQLDIFKEYATKIKKFEIAEKYESAAKIIRGILSQKRREVHKIGDKNQISNLGNRDSFFNALKDSCEDVFSDV